MAEQLYHFINGARVNGTSGREGDVFNPATGETQALCPYASTQEVDGAVQAALAAQPEWEATAAPRRCGGRRGWPPRGLRGRALCRTSRSFAKGCRRRS